MKFMNFRLVILLVLLFTAGVVVARPLAQVFDYEGINYEYILFVFDLNEETFTIGGIAAGGEDTELLNERLSIFVEGGKASGEYTAAMLRALNTVGSRGWHVVSELETSNDTRVFLMERPVEP